MSSTGPAVARWSAALDSPMLSSPKLSSPTLGRPPRQGGPAEPPRALASVRAPLGARALHGAELVEAQLLALDAWYRSREDRERAAETHAGVSREARLDAARELDLLEAEHAALLAHAERFLSPDARRDDRDPRPLAVLAHRNAWLRGKVQQRLEAHGVRVVTGTGDGAEAVAAVLCEQPDLLLVEDLLPSVTGVDVALRTRQFAPCAAVAVHAASRLHMVELLDAGARGWFSRRIPPADVADGLLQMLRPDDARTVQLL